MKPIVSFGEILARFSPPHVTRFAQGLPGTLDFNIAGAETNTAASIALLGGAARLVSALPRHAIADSCVTFLAGLGVDTSHILRTDEGRLGLYFFENGANQRPGNVIYDRSASSICLTPGSAYDWEAIFAGAGWFHTSGITPAVSEEAAEATVLAVQEAKRRGLTVSFDLNFRSKLWTWRPGTPARALAEETTRRILPFVDLVLANEGAALDTLSIRSADVAPEGRELDRYVGREIVKQFPNVSRVAVTLRENFSASHNSWGAALYEVATDTDVFAPLAGGKFAPYQITNIVDRIGGGDAFAGGLLFALNTPELSEPGTALAFAVATSCLAHSIAGDINYTSRSEAEALMNGSGNGRVVR